MFAAMQSPPPSFEALDTLQQRQVISPEAAARGRELLLPPPKEWAELVNRWLAWVGGLLVASGVIYLVAYNWDELDRFSQNALLQACFVVTAGIALWRGTTQVAGQVALLCASLLVGALFALHGQTYQTGADPYTLFAAWAVLLLPWALGSGLPALWVLISILGNVALVLFWVQVIQPPFAAGGVYLAHILCLINALLAVAWEGIARFRPTLRRWPAEVWMFGAVLVNAFTVGTWIVLPAEVYHTGVGWSLPIFVVFQLWCWGFGMAKGRSLPATGGMSLLILSAALLGRVCLEAVDNGNPDILNVVLFALSGLILSAEIAGLVALLRRLPEPKV